MAEASAYPLVAEPHYLIAILNLSVVAADPLGRRDD